jgi:hypothetical protein
MASPTPTTSFLTPTSTPHCTTFTPDSNGYVPPQACNAQWSYSPSYPAALALSTLFGFLTLTHIFLAFIFRKPFCWVIIMACAWETTAFILRALASRDQQSEAYAISSQLLFLLAPLWVNAFVYMVAGRLVYALHPDKEIWGVKAISLGTWFVWLDILSFVVQGAGGMMLSSENEEKVMSAGKNIYMTGVGLQQFFILVFVGLIGKFHVDLLRLEKQGVFPQEKTGNGKRAKMWKCVTYSLYVVLALITMRIIFRLVEFSGGVDPATNELPFKEGYALGLDAVPMGLAIVVLAVVHPSTVLRGEGSDFPSRKERKAEKKEKKAAKKDMKRAKKEGKNEVEMDIRYVGADRGGNGKELIGRGGQMGQRGLRNTV